MVVSQTKIKIIDNSGASFIRVFRLLRYPLQPKVSQVGDFVLGSVISYKAHKKIAKKEICKVLIVTKKIFCSRKSGSFTKFDETRGVIIKDQKLLGSRIFGPISKTLRKMKLGKLLVLPARIL